MAECFGLVVNLMGGQASRYADWEFNSLAILADGTPIAAGKDGIYELGGDRDDGDPIAAMAELPTTDWGSSKWKRVRDCVVMGEADGDIYVEVETDERERRSYLVDGLNGAHGQHADVITWGRGQVGTVFTVAFGNRNEDGGTDGADFSVDSIEVMPMMVPVNRTRAAIRRQ